MNRLNSQRRSGRHVGVRSTILAIPLALILPAFVLVTTQGASAASSQAADSFAATSSDGARTCKSLMRVAQPDTTYTSARHIARTDTVPGHCRVELIVKPAIKIAIALPDKWNGRFQGVGGSGYDGVLQDLDTAVAQGYAAGTTDSGHSAEEMPLATFGLDENRELNWQLIKDFAYRGSHQVALKGKALVKAYYERQATYSYFNGCSNGGRQALMEAQRFPDDYDGILAGSPAINWDRLAPGWLWPQLAMKEEVGDVIPACKFDLLNAAVMAQCDSIDGVSDGVIGDPRRCDFDPATLIGQGTACGEFTEADARAIQSIWDGPRTPDGAFLWYGLAPGAHGIERVAGPQPNPFPLSYIANWVKQDPDWDWRTLDYAGFENVVNKSVRRFNGVIGTDNPDLSPFRDSGGKVLIWHGWSDRSFPPEGTIDYYDKVVATLGKAQTERTARLFMAPGVSHCGGGPGPDSFDMLGALVDWVEKSKAPKKVVASKVVAGETVQTRPLCPYPQVAGYKGHGSTDIAKNFTCRLDYTPPHSR